MNAEYLSSLYVWEQVIFAGWLFFFFFQLCNKFPWDWYILKISFSNAFEVRSKSELQDREKYIEPTGINFQFFQIVLFIFMIYILKSLGLSWWKWEFSNLWMKFKIEALKHLLSTSKSIPNSHSPNQRIKHILCL